MDLRAAEGRRLGALGDPADLIVCEIVTAQRRRGSFRGVFFVSVLVTDSSVGHHGRVGLRDDEPSRSWNSSHPSRGPDGGCSQADLKTTGGDGLFYCFAAN